MHVLLVGSYRPLVKALKRGLEEEGIAVDVTSDGEEENAGIASAGYDAIVLDLMRPIEAGLSLLEGWRRAGLKTHVLVLAAPCGSTDHKIPSLSSAADDWLRKPFRLEELLARLRALVGTLSVR